MNPSLGGVIISTLRYLCLPPLRFILLYSTFTAETQRDAEKISKVSRYPSLRGRATLAPFLTCMLKLVLFELRCR